MDIFIIDAYAWIEYFRGSTIGVKVKSLVENPENKIITHLFTLAELASSYGREGLSFEMEEKLLLSLSSIHHPDISFAVEAGKLHAELRRERKHIGLADTMVLLTARKLGGKVVTGDEDFRGLKEVIMIK